jgi:Family of unknown function (DUF6928)
MGAKTGILAYTDSDLPSLLRSVPAPQPAAVVELITRLFPQWEILEPAGESTLDEATYPPEGFTYAAVFPGAEILCDQRFMLYDKPSQLPQQLIDASRGRRLILHAMHSVVDWFAYAVWDNGQLIRSLSLSPDDGIIENIGDSYPFEQPYWAGQHPVEPMFDDGEPYPLPFHPLELGEEALLALFGFQIEGYLDRNQIDAEQVPLLGFRVTDPQEETRRATLAGAVDAMGPPTHYRLGPDGKLVKVDSPPAG